MSNQRSLGLDKKKASGAVECMGQTFDSDEARRAHFTKLLAAKLKEPEFRKLPGFPKGSDEDILAMSDPPYHTACPNPFLEEAFAYCSDRHKEHRVIGPFVADVQEGKNDPVYNAHSYHTKVPPRAVARFVCHYTNDDEFVFDPFCGSGMTGVGCTSEYLSELVQPTATSAPARPRTAILNDLSPSASLIASFTNGRYSAESLDALSDILDDVESQYGHLYDVATADYSGRAYYTVWSELFRCPECSVELNLWKESLDAEQGKVRDSFHCKQCGSKLTKRNLERCLTTYYDDLLRQSIETTRSEPVVVDVFTSGSRRTRYELPEALAHETLTKVKYGDAPEPQVHKMMFRDGNWGDQWRDGYHTGVTHAHHFYTPRNYVVLNAIRSGARNTRFFREALGLLVAISQDTSKLARVKIGYYFKGGGGPFIPGVMGQA